MSTARADSPGVVLVGVGADSGNVRPPPAVGPDGRFEYVPIPEKAPVTTESRTFGSMPQRYGDGTLADLLAAIRPASDGPWLDDESTVREWPVHHDPNLTDLTFGAGGKDGNVRAIETHLSPGDVLAFYTGLETDGYMHRYIFGYFTVAAEPDILEPGDDTAAACARHEANAHARRFAANGDLYAFNPERPAGASRVALVDGRDPGGLLDRAVRLSAPDSVGNYYMRDALRERLQPSTDYLGGFKPPIACDITPADFLSVLDSRV